MSERFCLWRILGNDIPGRYAEGQTEKNLHFMLENEHHFAETKKMFLLNRIYDAKTRDRIKELLTRFGAEFEEIPFVPDEYTQQASMHDRVRYLTNLNQARNYCIRAGLDRFGAEYVLPFDGACFFREDGWHGFQVIAMVNELDAYFFVPMWRLKTYEQTTGTPPEQPQIREEWRFPGQRVIGITEPQVVFTRHSDVFFDESFSYPHLDKVQLIWRLGLAGVWDRWCGEDRKKALQSPSKFYNEIKMGGFVCRLPSGVPMADENNQVRGQLRSDGLKLMVARATETVR